MKYELIDHDYGIDDNIYSDQNLILNIPSTSKMVTSTPKSKFISKPQRTFQTKLFYSYEEDD